MIRLVPQIWGCFQGGSGSFEAVWGSCWVDIRQVQSLFHAIMYMAVSMNWGSFSGGALVRALLLQVYMLDPLFMETRL